MEEQRQRKADELRVPPQRTCTVRRPDCSSGRATVPFRKPIRLSERLVLAYEAKGATKNGAVLPKEADALIAEHLRDIEAQAAKFAAAGKRAVHFGDDADNEPPSPIRLKPRRSKKNAPEG